MGGPRPRTCVAGRRPWLQARATNAESGSCAVTAPYMHHRVRLCRNPILGGAPKQLAWSQTKITLQHASAAASLNTRMHQGGEKGGGAEEELYLRRRHPRLSLRSRCLVRDEGQENAQNLCVRPWPCRRCRRMPARRQPCTCGAGLRPQGAGFRVQRPLWLRIPPSRCFTAATEKEEYETRRRAEP